MKVRHWRPEVERLEPVTLLSGIAGEAHAPALAEPTAGVSLPNPLPLIGSLHGQAHTGFTSFTATGSGSFRGVGKVTFTVRGFAASPEAPVIDYGVLTVSSKLLGKLFVSYSSSDGETQVYRITRGTKAFANEMGSGTFAFSNSKHGKEVTLEFP
jgi:hypothetical protein